MNLVNMPGVLSVEAKGNLTITTLFTDKFAFLNPSFVGGILLTSVAGNSATFTLDEGAKLNIHATRPEVDTQYNNLVGIRAYGPHSNVFLNGATTITVERPGSVAGVNEFDAGIYIGGGGTLNSSGGLDITAINANGLVLNGGGGGTTATISGLINIKQSGGRSDQDANGGDGVSVTHGSSATLDGDVGSTIEGHRLGVLAAYQSSVELSNFAISTDSFGAGVLLAQVGSTITGTNLSLTATGDESQGVYVGTAGSSGKLTSVTIQTEGRNSVGAYVSGALDGKGLEFATSEGGGNSVSVYGDGSIGVDVEKAGQVTMSRTNVFASGANSTGVLVNSSIGADLADAVVSTAGAASAAIEVKKGVVTLQNTSINTQGDGSAGMLVSGGLANINQSVTIETKGDNSAGIAISGGMVNIDKGVTIETYGIGSDGLLVYKNAALGEIDSGTKIATHGEGANAFSLTGDGNIYTFNAVGLRLANLSAENGALIQASDGATLKLTKDNPFATSMATIANGTPSSWGAIAGSGGTVQLDDGVDTNGNALLANVGGTLVFNGSASAANSIVQLDAAAGAHSLAVIGSPAGKLSATGSTLSIGALKGAGLVAMGSAVTRLNLGSDQATAAGTYIFSGATQGSADLYKLGSNTQVMQGDVAWVGINDSYLNGGVLQITGLADPSAFNKTFNIGNGWLDLSGTSARFDRDHPETAADWGDINLQYTPGGTGGVIGSNDKINIADEAIGYQIGGDPALNGVGVYVVKNGPGTSTVTADNTYVGNTQINAGTLQVTRDTNLGDATVDREVRLQGGNLQISKGGSDFQSQRAVQVFNSGSVIVDADVTATLGSVATYTKDANGVLTPDGNAVFTKDGAGALSVGLVGLTGGLVVVGGGLSAGDGYISNANSGVAISAAGGTSLSLVHVNVDGTSAGVYTVSSAGTSTFKASGGSQLSGDISSSVAGAVANVDLSGGTQLNGVITQSNGGQVNATLADAGTVWNMSGDSSPRQLTNNGVIQFLTPTITGSVAQYKTLSVAGDYTGGGTIGMNTELGLGGAVPLSNTDKVMITGNATGTTTLDINASGTGVDTNVKGDNKFHAGEGISVVQVDGSATATSFKLKNDFVTSGSVYQYRLFSYGPLGPYGPSGVNGGTGWDYRLQTAYEDDQGNIIPEVPTVAPPGARPLVVPQTSSYLIAPLVLQRYNAMLMSGLHARLGDIASSSDELGDETFARTLGESGSYTSNRSFQQYGFGFDQHSQALQFGGNFLRYTAADGDTYRMGLAATIGSVRATPRTTQATSSNLSIEAYNLALTSTWVSAQGWYADGLLGASFYRANVDGLDRNAGTLYGTGVDFSLEAGRRITLASGVEIEPHAQFMGQTTHFRDMVDADGVKASLGNTQAWTTGAGIRVSYPIYNKGTTIKPYADLGGNYTWMAGDQPSLAGQKFTTANVGGGVQLALGVSAQLSDRLQVYGEANGLARPGSGFGNSAAGGNFGIRYSF
ncbi:autotransporter outer membrane beta-barrel domain-containing protein [Pseudomonas fluorescens]|uniref:Autotransporter domain-containing protein n=1 Tax=Pseudomonas fluorescens TaxID=294 RepID=A0A5E6Y316_PSEFL|nr:autotransporter outer membrane beta-barrel domain-containing protein [Pseudomonas fluorescens]VVN46461.1 hypothetical protein PS655_05871 [Pseudomonas fluorescens]